MEKVVQVKLGEFRGISLYNLKDVTCKRGDYVILSVDRATEYGKIISEMDSATDGHIENLPGKVIRLVTEEDLNRIERNKEKIKEAMALCVKKIAEQKLKMKFDKHINNLTALFAVKKRNFNYF